MGSEQMLLAVPLNELMKYTFDHNTRETENLGQSFLSFVINFGLSLNLGPRKKLFPNLKFSELRIDFFL